MTAIVSAVEAVGTASWLIWRSLRGMVRRWLADDPLADRSLAEAMGRFIWSPLPKLMILSGLVGLIAALSAMRLLALYNAELLVVRALIDVLLRQILPLIVGIFASGSVSVEIATRLAAMSLSHEIDALEAMGHDPVEHALAPAVTAVIVASPVHMVASAVAALIAAAIPLHISANIGWRAILQPIFSNVAAGALLTGIVKSSVFAVIALGDGATVGSLPASVPAEIGHRAGRAFAGGLLGIFAAGALWTAIA